MIDFRLWAGCWTKDACFFPKMSHSVFILIIRRVLEVCFGWKQLKVDCSKNIWKEENSGNGFLFPLLNTHQFKYIIENCNSVDAEAHKVGKTLAFYHNFGPYFPDIWRGVKRQIIYIEKGWS